MPLTTTPPQVETRKGKDLTESLTRKKEELAGMRAALSAQTIEINRLQSEHGTKDKRLNELEKKLSAYDDSFYSLEARNVRDRTRMEEMGKAKAKAEEERSVYRLMLEQVCADGRLGAREPRGHTWVWTGAGLANVLMWGTRSHRSNTAGRRCWLGRGSALRVPSVSEHARLPSAPPPPPMTTGGRHWGCRVVGARARAQGATRSAPRGAEQARSECQPWPRTEGTHRRPGEGAA